MNNAAVNKIALLSYSDAIVKAGTGVAERISMKKKKRGKMNMIVRCHKCKTKFEIEILDDEYPTICPNCDEVDAGIELCNEMQSFWIFQRCDNKEWDVLEEEKFSELPGVAAGSLRIINAKNRAEALAIEIGVEKVIRRIFNETLRHDNGYIYHKWFGGEEEIA